MWWGVWDTGFVALYHLALLDGRPSLLQGCPVRLRALAPEQSNLVNEVARVISVVFPQKVPYVAVGGFLFMESPVDSLLN